MFQILTPDGYVAAESLNPGDSVSAWADGVEIVNTIESIEWIDADTYRQRTNNPTVSFNNIIVNGKPYFQDQSFWCNGNVCHATDLKIGDVIYDDVDGDVTVISISEETSDGWYRLEVSGDHSYIIDGLQVHNASRFWILGTGTWDNSTTTQWSATTGGGGGASVPGASDSATFDGSSGGGTVTPNYSMTITTLTWNAYTGTIDFSVNNPSPTFLTFNGSGSSTRGMKLGSGTYTVTGNASANLWQTGTTTGLTWDPGTSLVQFTYAGATGTRTITTGTAQLYNMAVTAGTDTVVLSSQYFGNSVDFTGFTGSFTGANTATLTGNFTLGTGMTVTSGAGNFSFTGTSGTQVFKSNGVQFNKPITINNPGATFQLFDALDMTGASARTLTLTSGTLDTNSKTVSVDIFSWSNSNVRTLTLGSSNFNIVGSAATVMTVSTSTNATLNAGTSNLNFTYAGATGTRTIGLGTTLTYNNINISAGSDTVSVTGNGTIANNFSFAGFTGTNSAMATIGITGNWTYGIGMTCTSVANTMTFQATSGTQIFTSNSVQASRPITVNAPGATLQLADALDMGSGSGRLLTLTAGTFDANNKPVTIGGFSSSNSNVRVLTMGSAQWTAVGNNLTIWTQSTATNMTTNVGSLPVICNYAGSVGTRTLQTGQISTQPEAQAISFSFTAGTDTIVFTGTSRTYGSLDFTGFAGTWTVAVSQNIFGNLTISSGMTQSLGGQLVMKATSGTKTLTSNGNTTNSTGMAFDGVGGTFQLGDAFSTTGPVTLTNGTFTDNGKNLTTSAFTSANTNTRTITMGTATVWTLTGAGTVWDTSTTTGLTFTKGTATILLNDGSSSSKTFSDGGLTFYNLTLDGTGSGTFIIGTATTTMGVNTWAITNPPHAIQIFAGKTINATTITWSGVTGAKNTFQSTSAGSPWIISIPSGTMSEQYLNLQDSTATGGATFNATNSADWGDNTGWNITNPNPHIIGISTIQGVSTITM